MLHREGKQKGYGIVNSADRIMRIQISEAAPRIMGYFIARSQGRPVDAPLETIPEYTGDPAQASPLIESLRTHRLQLHENAEQHVASARIESPNCLHYGTTAHIAALRCYLTVIYGNFLEVPDALIPEQLNYRNLWSASACCGE